jgi:Tfp pilus assembly protein PilF
VAGWQLWSRLVPHLDGIIETAVKFRFEDEILSRLCNEYGLWLYHQARYQTAEPLYQRSLAIFEKALGPDHPDVALSLENYAALLRKLDRTAEAETMKVRAKAIRATR